MRCHTWRVQEELGVKWLQALVLQGVVHAVGGWYASLATTGELRAASN